MSAIYLFEVNYEEYLLKECDVFLDMANKMSICPHNLG
jgi:hypothetical protein